MNHRNIVVNSNMILISDQAPERSKSRNPGEYLQRSLGSKGIGIIAILSVVHVLGCFWQHV